MVITRLTPPLACLQRTCCLLYKAAIAQGNSHICFQSQAVPSRCLTVTASAASVFTLLFLAHTPSQAKAPLAVISRKHSIISEDINKENSKDFKVMAVPQISDALKKAKAEAIWGLFVADALAMPVHWYYETSDIKHDYGSWITGFVAPHDRHPSSILRLSAVDGSGRGSNSSSKPLIGSVILHDKLQYWNGENPNNHYHQGMNAGDNTLNAVMALHELQTINKFDHDLVQPEREVRAAVLEDYVSFMTSPNSHNDTYAESFHRSFFRAWVDSGESMTGSDIIEFAEKRSQKMLKSTPDHQLAVVGSLVPAIPWIIKNAHKPENECVQSVIDFVKLTHPVSTLLQFVEVYARLLHAVLNGRDLKSQVMQFLGNSIFGGPSNRDKILKKLDEATRMPKGSEARLQVYQSMISLLGPACYIEGALNSLLFLALGFHDDFEGGVLANVNCGGENCHRGAALGALLAAAAAHRGSEVPATMKAGLNSLRTNIETVVRDMNTSL